MAAGSAIEEFGELAGLARLRARRAGQRHRPHRAGRRVARIEHHRLARSERLDENDALGLVHRGEGIRERPPEWPAGIDRLLLPRWRGDPEARRHQAGHHRIGRSAHGQRRRRAIAPHQPEESCDPMRTEPAFAFAAFGDERLPGRAGDEDGRHDR